MNKKIIAWEKEQKRLSDLEKIKEKLERLNNYLQTEFNRKYLFHIFLIFLPISILGVSWVIYGNTFDDGIIRFLLLFLAIDRLVFFVKSYFFNKLKLELERN